MIMAFSIVKDSVRSPLKISPSFLKVSFQKLWTAMGPQLTISDRQTEYKDLEARVDALKAAQDQMLRYVRCKQRNTRHEGILTRCL